MQDQKSLIADPANDPTAAVEALAEQAEKAAVPGMVDQDDILERVIEKIRGAENILVTLSRDPSVDEMAGALALTMFLDGLQKHTTAIYSGKTPDALKFLQPEGTFESNTASLQDFIIALSKNKADHLRYKLEGDFVKIYITPYKTTLSEADLEFSRGDYNVDLVLAIAVPSAGDLDEALTEYGRIMHDATTIDITCEAPGRFGEIEWSDPKASSVSEMLTRLIFRMEGENATLETEVANALLTGIVAATGRFSNERTNSETMQLAAKLMTMGADQQMVAMHVIDSEAEAKAEAEAEEERARLAQAQAEADAAARAAAKAADKSGTTVAVDERALAQAKARAMMEANAEAAVNRAVTTATENAAAVGASGVGIQPVQMVQPVQVTQPVQLGQVMQSGQSAEVGMVGPSLPPVQMPMTEPAGAPVVAEPMVGVPGVTEPAILSMPRVEVQPQSQQEQINPGNPVLPTVASGVLSTGGVTSTENAVLAPGPKNYGAMIEQALAEPLPVETAASAAGLLKTPAAPVSTGINPAVMAAPQEAAEAAAPILGTMSTKPVEPVNPAGGTTPVMTPGTTLAATPMAEPVVTPVTMPGVAPVATPEMTMPAAPEMKPGQTVLPPAPAPEVGMGLMPPVGAGAPTMGLASAPMSNGSVMPGAAGAGAGTPATAGLAINSAVGTGPSAAPGVPGAPGAFQIPGTV